MKDSQIGMVIDILDKCNFKKEINMVLLEVHNHHDQNVFIRLMEKLFTKKLLLTNYYEKFNGFLS